MQQIKQVWTSLKKFLTPHQASMIVQMKLELSNNGFA